MAGNFQRLSVAAVLFAALLPAMPAPAQDNVTMRYDRPGTDWEHEGLPIGNGAMGAMILGGVASDRIQFNEKTLWTGGPGIAGYDFGRPAASFKNPIAQLRRELNEKKRLEPEAVAKQLGHKALGYGDYQNFGDLLLTQDGAAGAVGDYRRTLDLATAVASLRYKKDGVGFARDYFASYPAHVIVIRLTADTPGQISFTARLAIPGNRSLALHVADGRLTASGALHDNGLRYEAQIQIIAQGGKRSDGVDSVAVAGADSALIIIGAGTDYADHYPDYRGADPHGAVQARIDAAAAQGYDRLLAAHEADYRALFDRVSLDIGQAMPDLPTDQLLMQYKDGTSPADRALEALFFQYGRYLLIASSRAGSLPANLQGVWNNSATPPWNADYHVNINLQMNYWPSETANLAETETPLFDFIDALVPSGNVTARQVYGADGWVMNLDTNAWGYTGLIDWPTAFWQPEGAAWLLQQYYEHYLFSRDETFLARRAYPAMKAAARFWLDELDTDPHDGRLVVSPSYSPEHGPFSVGASMSQQIVFNLFTNVSQAAHRLNDTAFAAKIDAALAKLDPGLRIGFWGQLQEWKEDWDDRSDAHRHVSHLFALDPGDQISPRTTPALADAARISLRARGDGGTGWSKAWKIGFWARLLDGDHAHKMLGEQLRESTLPNLLDTCPPFQIDGNFGAVAGIAEMLLQSQTGEVDILPALPGTWRDGVVRGLRARGDLTLDIAWSNAKARRVRLVAGHGGRVRLRSTLFERPFALTDVENHAVAVRVSGTVGSFQTGKGGVYTLRASN